MRLGSARSPAGLVLALVLGVCVSVSASACAGARERHLAELIDAEGRVEESGAAAPERWLGAGRGHRFVRGAGARTGPASSARLRLADGGMLRMGSASLVRFGGAASDGATEAPGVSLEAGEAEIETGAAEMIVATRGGRARLPAGTRVRLSQGEGGARLVVEVGSALIEQDGSDGISVPSGSQLDFTDFVLSVTPATLRTPAAAAAGPGPGLVAPPEGAADAGSGTSAHAVDLPGGSIDLDEQLATADFTLGIDENATVHDPSPPSAVRLEFAHVCKGTALVEVRHGRSRTRVQGESSVVVALTAGAHAVQVRCIGPGGALETKPRARSALRVVHDAGKRRVAPAAPRNVVDADGRKYRLLYQNRKPEIAFQWPDAPRATGYTLAVEDVRGQVRRYRAARAHFTLPSGQLAEGSYSFWFAADAPSGAAVAQSPRTHLALDFDNAAPVATVDEPSNATAWTDANVYVAGSATEGASVSIGGVALAVDDDFRFAARVAVPTGGRAVAVRIAQRGRGVHYFVRRRP